MSLPLRLSKCWFLRLSSVLSANTCSGTTYQGRNFIFTLVREYRPLCMFPFTVISVLDRYIIEHKNTVFTCSYSKSLLQ